MRTDVGMRVDINSSLHENHVAIMGRKGSYLLDEPFSQFTSGSIRQFRSYTLERIGWLDSVGRVMLYHRYSS